MERILNIASGNEPPIDIKQPIFLVNVDTMFYNNVEPHIVEQKAELWLEEEDKILNIKSDVFEFMERTVLRFDRVCIYRFLEHVSFTQVLYFIYLVSRVTTKGDVVDVIVPNYEILAKMILEEDPLDPAGGNFEPHNITLTTELLNEPSCPHASVWTPNRANYFWELEARFKVHIISETFAFDGRELYLRFLATRI